MAGREKKPQPVIRLLISLFLAMAVSGSPSETYGLAGGGGQDQPIGAACQADKHCQSDFCDAGICRLPEVQYGSICTPAPLTAEGLRNGKLNTCGAYICTEGRCRSCKSDSQCQQEYGAPACQLHATRPGKRCGAY